MSKRIVRVVRVEPSDRAEVSSQAAAPSLDVKQQTLSPPTISDASKSWGDIFDGRSLDGWQRDGAATWTLEDGVLFGRAAPLLALRFVALEQPLDGLEPLLAPELRALDVLPLFAVDLCEAPALARLVHQRVA